MIGLQEIQRVVAGRPLLMVGNGPASTMIPDGCLVVRMNHGIVAGPADFWLNGLAGKAQLQRQLADGSSFRYVLRLNSEPRRGGNYMRWGLPEHLYLQTHFWNEKDFAEMTLELGYSRPTTGITGLYWFLSNTRPTSVFATGFDHFATPSRFTGQRLASVHSAEKERDCFQRLVQVGNVEVL